MTQLALILSLAAALTVSSGELPVFSNTTHGEHGPEDGSHGHHSHHGDDEGCHPHVHLPASTLPVADLKFTQPASVRFPGRRQEVPPSPDPGDISHVPKTQLA